MRTSPVKGAQVLVVGATFKADVRDVRNAGAVDVVATLRRFGCAVELCDPIADSTECEREIGLPNAAWPPTYAPTTDPTIKSHDNYAAVVVLVPHAAVRAWLDQLLPPGPRATPVWMNATGGDLADAGTKADTDLSHCYGQSLYLAFVRTSSRAGGCTNHDSGHTLAIVPTWL